MTQELFRQFTNIFEDVATFKVLAGKELKLGKFWFLVISQCLAFAVSKIHA